MAKITLYESQGLKPGKPIVSAGFQYGTPLLKGYEWSDVEQQQGSGDHFNVYDYFIPGTFGEIKVLAVGKEKTLKIYSTGSYEVWM